MVSPKRRFSSGSAEDWRQSFKTQFLRPKVHEMGHASAAKIEF
jgi:hypothetical protein